MDTREQIKAAFSNLRKQGYIARSAFMCCGGCAGCAIALRVEEMPAEKRAKVRGAVFYTQQDAKAFDDPRCGDLMLRFGRIETAKHGDIGDETDDPIPVRDADAGRISGDAQDRDDRR